MAAEKEISVEYSRDEFMEIVRTLMDVQALLAPLELLPESVFEGEGAAEVIRDTISAALVKVREVGGHLGGPLRKKRSRRAHSPDFAL
jgi:hypothetical protein